MTPSGTVDAWKPYTRGDGGQGPIGGNLGDVMRVILDVVQGPLEGRQFILDRHGYVHRGPVAVRALPDAGGHGAVARSLHDRGQSADVRTAGPGEHQRDVRQQPSGGPGPTGLGGRDRGGAERLPRRGRVGGDDVIVGGPRTSTERTAAPRRSPGRSRCAGCGRLRPAEPDDRGPGGRRRERAGRVVVLVVPLRVGEPAPARAVLHDASASWAAGRWAWSIRPVTT